MSASFSFVKIGSISGKLIQKAGFKRLKIFHDFLDRFLEKSSKYG